MAEPLDLRRPMQGRPDDAGSGEPHNDGEGRAAAGCLGTIALVAGTLHSSGGLELCELAICRELARRRWRIRVSAARGGDLLEHWSTFASVSLQDAGCEGWAGGLVGAQLVYVHDRPNFPSGIRLGRELNVPVLAHLHLPPPVRRGWRRYLRGRFRERMDPAIYSRTTRVTRFLAPSQHLRQTWIDVGLPPGQIAVVHNGVDTDRFRPPEVGEWSAARGELGIISDELVFGYVGRIDPTKGVAELLEAFRQVRRELPRARLVIVGELSRWLQERGSEYETELRVSSPDGVSWLGKRNDSDRLYRSFDVVVVPSQWDEPFGLVAAEAMASGVPVVATQRGGLPEVLEGELAQGLCGAAPAELAAAMVRLGRDGLMRARLGAIGRRRAVESFTVERMVDGVEANLLELIGTAPPAAAAS